MNNLNSKIALLACQDCNGICSTILPELILTFGEQLQIMPVSCHANLKPLSFISLLRNGWGGLLVLCPKDKCCWPKKAKSVMRKEALKGILPVFGISRERLEIVSNIPFETKQIKAIIENMLEVIRIEGQNDLWVNKDDFGLAQKFFIIN